MYNIRMKEKTKNNKKKLPVWAKILLLPFELILAVLIILLIWFTFCFFNRTKSIDALPPEYAVYVRTDSIFHNVDPLLDLDATLIAMTDTGLQKFREPYLNIKKSKLRKNFFVKMALKRRLDVAVYEPDQSNNSNTAPVVAILDAGFLSGATRLAPYIIPHIKQLSDKVELCSNNFGQFYKFQEAGYFAIHKNLVIYTTSRERMFSAMTFKNRSLYNPQELETMEADLKEPLRILADTENIINLLSDNTGNSNAGYYLNSVVPFIPENEYAALNFGITNSELNISISVPYDLPEESAEHPVIKLLQKDSKVPSLLPKLSDDVQYYTLMNAGSLSELKDAAAKILPKEKGFEAAWEKADSVCKVVFSKNLSEVLFSWTGDEFAVFGIEGKSEPVLGIKISDEAKRREIFDKVFSSFIVQSNDSLLIDGIRVPCIQVPSFFTGVLNSLDINVPKPYYLVRNDFIYFSESPENLIALNSISGKSKKLSSSESWKRVSSKQTPVSSLSLFYNLERSIPFFIKGNSIVSQILGLYNLGRFDIKVKDKTLLLQLQAASIEVQSSKSIPGFPMELENKSNSLLEKSNVKKNSQLFWIEADSSVNTLNFTTFEKAKLEINDLDTILAADEVTAKSGGELWVTTTSALVYLLNSKLECLEGFPVLTGVNMSCPPFIYKDKLALVDEDGIISFVGANGEITTMETNTEASIKSTPAVKDDKIALYEKGFFGGIHLYKNLEEKTKNGPLELDGIAYESPCIFSQGGNDYVAMITQSGMLYVFNFNLEPVRGFPLELDGVFYVNVKAIDGNIYALSSEGELYKVSLDGSFIRLKIPYFSAKSGRITIENYDDAGSAEIFVSGEGNSLYGFDKDLELLPGFPVSGYGNPIFVDLNGDNKKDCVAVTLDNKISAANVLK